jgi:hypothetical protein
MLIILFFKVMLEGAYRNIILLVLKGLLKYLLSIFECHIARINFSMFYKIIISIPIKLNLILFCNPYSARARSISPFPHIHNRNFQYWTLFIIFFTPSKVSLFLPPVVNWQFYLEHPVKLHLLKAKSSMISMFIRSVLCV